MNKSISICWLRRDLRLDDHAALYHALRENKEVLPLFIFDTTILDMLEDKADKRVQFIYREIVALREELKKLGSTMIVRVGKPATIWQELLQEWDIQSVYTNHDYEPYAMERDAEIGKLLTAHGVPFKTFKDQVIFEKEEIVKDDKLPYTVFTPYSRKWKEKLQPFYYKAYPTSKYFDKLYKSQQPFDMPSLESMGFHTSEFHYPAKVIKADIIRQYSEQRDYPAVHGTSHLGLHLRFGTLSIRKLLSYALNKNQTFVSELIWRDFYQQILWHSPHVAKGAFKKDYDHILWLNDEKQFKAWCEGRTGYPLVDAGMRELNETGFMHNRVRMVTASFLAKHLLIDWRWGEAYFAEKLLDFDLAANNGGWQWSAGCGTDAAPYFRIFNPTAQMERFDPKLEYVKKWVPEYGTDKYPAPIVDHAMARERCLAAYKKALKPE